VELKSQALVIDWSRV